ncbi:MAG: tRNA 2-selenouridine(34) synthase MnmH [Bacteroidota bacterium]
MGEVRQITIQAFLDDAQRPPLIDVRSPGEYNNGHILGAHNVPLFSDSERAHVGTVYKHEGPKKAKEIGYAYVLPKLDTFVSEAERLAPEGRVVVHCWRGGLRSQSFAEHLLKEGIADSPIIWGGYKAYRQYLLASFEEEQRMIVLAGYTGSAKTAILHELRQQGEQIIDLEGYANHKGSAFGAIGESEQPTNEHYHNILFSAWSRLSRIRNCWVEDEGIMIGRVNVPIPIFNQIRAAKTVFLEVPKKYRVQYLVDQYAHSGDELIADGLSRIKKRLGGLDFQKSIEALGHKDYHYIAERCLSYYDKYYLRSIKKRPESQVNHIVTNTIDPQVNADLILKRMTP